ncbi:hypothetical protein Ddc_14291 [Ditylenchus destructor]|nr:hypothetical protein Ddc_14291 [Ditylenchus destructor]
MFPKHVHFTTVNFFLLILLHATIFIDHADAAVTTNDCRFAVHHFSEIVVSYQIEMDGLIYTLAHPKQATKLIDKINEYKTELAKHKDEIEKVNEVSIKKTVTLSKFEETLGKVHSSWQQQINEIKDLEKQNVATAEPSQSKDKAPEISLNTSIATNAKTLSEEDIRKLINAAVFKGHSEALDRSEKCAPHEPFNLTEILVAKKIKLDGEIYNLHKHLQVKALVTKINEYKKELNERIQQLKRANELSANLTATLSKFEEALAKAHTTVNSGLQQQIHEIKALEKQHTPAAELCQVDQIAKDP